MARRVFLGHQVHKDLVALGEIPEALPALRVLRVLWDSKESRGQLGLKALKDRRESLETLADLGERQGLKDQSALRVLSATQVSKAIAVPKDPKDRKAPLGLKDPSATQVSKAILAHKVLLAPRGRQDP